MGNQASNEIVFQEMIANKEAEVLKLLKSGIDPCSLSKKGVSVMRGSLEKGMFSVFKYCYLRQAVMVPVLENGQTALHRAVKLGNYKFTSKLIRDPLLFKHLINLQDSHGKTALHIAVETGNSDLVSLLLKYNANRNLRDCEMKTPYDIAISSQAEMADEIIEQLTIEDYLSKLPLEDISPARDQFSTQDSKSACKEEKGFSPSLEALVQELRVPLIRSEEIKILEMISKGSSCLVFKAKWRGSEVAVKQFTAEYSTSPKELKKFIKELQVLSQVRHPNLLLLMGICIDSANLCIITELMSNYTLFYAIHKNKQKKLNLAEKFSISIQICRGLSYLHTNSPPIVHRDLKPENILMDVNLNLKIADFGLARPHSTFIEESTTICVGTTRFMAPELFDRERSENIGVEVDIWAFGCMLIEIFSGKRPWHYINSNKANTVFYEIYHKKPLPIPDNVLPEIAEIIKECCKYNPKRRIPIFQVLERLESAKSVYIVN